MKIQIAFDVTDLSKAIELAKQVNESVDIFEIGTLLLYQHGIHAIEAFRNAFPKKIILVDSKIVDRPKELITVLARAGADWVTVMAGANKDTIHLAATTANQLNCKIMLDTADSSSLGQTALEAKNLGAQALLFHQPYDEKDALLYLDKWDMVRGNSGLPIFVAAKITRDTIDKILSIKPDGIILGRSVLEAENPAAEAQFYAEIANK